MIEPQIRYLAFVGMQPEAVAPTWLTWMAASEGERIVAVTLLWTPQTKKAAKRLAEWMTEVAEERDWPLEAAQPVAVEPDGEPLDGQIERLCRSAERVVLHGDPGLGHHVARAAATLGRARDESSWERLHAGFWSMQSVNPRGEPIADSLRLKDIGLPTLFRLRGVPDPTRRRKNRSALPGFLGAKARARLGPSRRLSKEAARGARVLAVFERAGRLFAVAQAADRTEARAALDLDVAGVRAEVFLFGHTAAAAQRSREVRTATGARVREGRLSRRAERRFEAWLDRGWTPGHEMAANEVQRHKGRLPRARQGQSDGSATPGCDALVCHMGTDPSSTLVELWTHRPARALILVDPDTPAALEKAHRLANRASYLWREHGQPPWPGARRLEFGKCTRLGAARPPDWLEGLADVRLAVTPGTKPQGCSLAGGGWRGVPVAVSPRLGRSFELGGGRSWESQGPDLETQAVVRGAMWIARKRVDPGRREFFRLLLEFLLDRIHSEWKRRPVKRRNFADLGEYRDGVRLRSSGRRFTVEFEGRKASATIRHPRNGDWFEEMTAVAVADCPIVDEVRWGLEWTWTEGGAMTFPSARDELDVAARVGSRFLALSCKAGRNVRLPAVAREVESLASTCLGRATGTVVVRPAISDGAVQRQRASNAGSRYIDLRVLADPEALAEHLQKGLEVTNPS